MCSFGLADRPINAQQKLVIVVGRIIQAVGVGQERAEAKRTWFQELIPVFAGAGQAAHLQPEDQPDVIHRNFGQQALEAGAALGAAAAQAEVVVDDGNVLGWPAQSGRKRSTRSILAGGGLLMFQNLLGRGLADVDDGGTVTPMPGPEFLGEGRDCSWSASLRRLGLMKPGEELSEQVVQLPRLPDQWQVGPRQRYRREEGADGGVGSLRGRGKWTSLGSRHAAPPGCQFKALPAPDVRQFKQRRYTDCSQDRGRHTTSRLRCSVRGGCPPYPAGCKSGRPSSSATPGW